MKLVQRDKRGGFPNANKLKIWKKAGPELLKKPWKGDSGHASVCGNRNAND